MADVEELLLARLTSTAAVTALVGTRIYPDFAPEAAQMPYVIYSREHSQSFSNFGVVLKNCFAGYSFASTAKTHKAARETTEAIRRAFDYWSTTGPPIVDLVLVQNDFSTFQSSSKGDFMGYTSVIDFEVKYRHE